MPAASACRVAGRRQALGIKGRERRALPRVRLDAAKLRHRIARAADAQQDRRIEAAPRNIVRVECHVLARAFDRIAELSRRQLGLRLCKPRPFADGVEGAIECREALRHERRKIADAGERRRELAEIDALDEIAALRIKRGQRLRDRAVHRRRLVAGAREFERPVEPAHLPRRMGEEELRGGRGRARGRRAGKGVQARRPHRPPRDIARRRATSGSSALPPSLSPKGAMAAFRSSRRAPRVARAALGSRPRSRAVRRAGPR